MHRLLILLTLSAAVFFRAAAQGDDAYRRLFPDGACNVTAYRFAVQGFQTLRRQGVLRNERYLTIVDFTRPSNARRLFVIDMQRNVLALSSITAHGVGSDPDSTTFAQGFGNTDGCRMSSVGFYLTGSTYTNHRPLDSLGLCLFGLDKGFNDAAAMREIVVHYGATEGAGRVYVTDSGAARSYGCPALPLSTNTAVISLIRGGSVLFVYSDKVREYPAKSTVLNGGIRRPVIQKGPPPNNCRCAIYPRVSGERPTGRSR